MGSFSWAQTLQGVGRTLISTGAQPAASGHPGVTVGWPLLVAGILHLLLRFSLSPSLLPLGPGAQSKKRTIESQEGNELIEKQISTLPIVRSIKDKRYD